MRHGAPPAKAASNRKQHLRQGECYGSPANEHANQPEAAGQKSHKSFGMILFAEVASQVQWNDTLVHPPSGGVARLQCIAY